MSAIAARHLAQRPPKDGSNLRILPALRPIGLRVALAAMPNRAPISQRKNSLPSGNPVGASEVGITDRPNHHDHAPKIAVGFDPFRPLAESATFGLSSRRASLIT
jgi:hypothetical protein